MTGNPGMDWALVAVSLFNTILLLWLALTVLLNAEQRNRGIWLMSGGLLMGAAFFTSHTAILGHNSGETLQGVNFWWQIGWIPVIASPFAWYIMILWYSGFWSDPDSSLRRRHVMWLIVLAVMAAIILGLILFGHPLPSFTEIAALDLSTSLTAGGIPVLFVLFPIFTVLCIGLSLDALWRPAPSERLMGDLARQRTRPWLMAAATLLLLVGGLVAAFVAWVVQSARLIPADGIPLRIMQAAVWFDLVIDILIALAIVALGQGIVSYEVFTGRALPRRGFFRHWRSAVILAGGYSIIIGWTLAVQLRPIYSLLLTTVLIATFYALYSWRSFVEREHFMAHLRPFVGSQEFVKHLIGSERNEPSRAAALFQALCADVLNIAQAQLVPLGPLASLAGSPLVIPPGARVTSIPAPALRPDPHELLPVDDPAQPYRWAVPLWTERGLIGMMLLGDKQDRSLYTQEEIEIARSSGERIVDMLAGEEMARRLLALQRQRLVETQVMDRQTRRALHDELLPSLHTAILRLSSLSQNEAAQEAIAVLSEAHHQIANLIRTPPKATLLNIEQVGLP